MAVGWRVIWYQFLLYTTNDKTAYFIDLLSIGTWSGDQEQHCFSPMYLIPIFLVFASGDTADTTIIPPAIRHWQCRQRIPVGLPKGTHVAIRRYFFSFSPVSKVSATVPCDIRLRPTNINNDPSRYHSYRRRKKRVGAFIVHPRGAVFSGCYSWPLSSRIGVSPYIMTRPPAQARYTMRSNPPRSDATPLLAAPSTVAGWPGRRSAQTRRRRRGPRAAKQRQTRWRNRRSFLRSRAGWVDGGARRPADEASSRRQS